MSRINFAKVHTVDYNVKVMDIGHMGRNLLDCFGESWHKSS
jgi:hypothetical protein